MDQMFVEQIKSKARMALLDGMSKKDTFESLKRFCRMKNLEVDEKELKKIFSAAKKDYFDSFGDD